MQEDRSLVVFVPVLAPATDSTESDSEVASVPRRARLPRGVRLAVFIVLEILAALVVWQAIVWLFDVNPLVLPGPVDVLVRLWALLQSEVLWSAIGVTLTEVVFGFLSGAVLGIGLAVLLSEFRVLEKIAQPYIVAFQAMPKIAIAPLFLIWFGFGIESKVLLIALMVFFPILVNMVAGLTSPTPAQVELMAVYRAGRVRTLRHLRWYCALPYMFAAFEVTLVLAVTGAVFAEIIGSGTTIGLGTLLQLYTARIDVTTVFAVIIVMSTIGILLYGAVKLARAWALRWQRHA